jgi:hypothetical protein
VLAVGGLGVLLLLAGLSGCATWELSDVFSWSDAAPKPKTPARMTDIWTDTILYQPGQPGVRGFGGRVMFYNNDGPKAIPVDGTFTVLAFDDSTRNSDQGSPEKKYIIRPEELPQHYSKSDLGHSYSFWLPWDEVGGPDRRICLVARFEPRKGKAVVSSPSHHTLPGADPEAKLPASNAAAVRASAPDAGGVQRASFETATRDLRPQEEFATLTLDVPPSFVRTGTNAAGAQSSQSAVTGSRLPVSAESSASAATSGAHLGSAAGASPSAHSAPNRFPARKGSAAPPTSDPVRRQPLPATWQSRLPPTPRTGWPIESRARRSADEPDSRQPPPPTAE